MFVVEEVSANHASRSSSSRIDRHAIAAAHSVPRLNHLARFAPALDTPDMATFISSENRRARELGVGMPAFPLFPTSDNECAIGCAAA